MTVVAPAPPERYSQSSPASSRLPALDLVRVVAMAGVIAIHTVAWVGRDTPTAALWYRTLDSLARASVPSFIMLTGAVLAHASSGWRPEPAAFLYRRAIRVGLPWLVWSVVWSTVWFLLVPVLTGEGLPAPAEVFAGLAAGPGYLYFLLLILQISVVFVVFPTSLRARAWTAVAAVAVQLALSLGRLSLADAPDLVWWLLEDYAYELGFFWAGFFALGVLAGGNMAALARTTPARVLAAVAVAGVSFPRPSVCP